MQHKHAGALSLRLPGKNKRKKQIKNVDIAVYNILSLLKDLMHLKRIGKTVKN